MGSFLYLSHRELVKDAGIRKKGGLEKNIQCWMRICLLWTGVSGFWCWISVERLIWLQAILAFFFFLQRWQTEEDIWLILKFSGAATDIPIVEWIKNMELRDEHILLLHS